MNSRGISVRSLTESCDAGTSSAQLIVHLMAALAKSEHELIGEPTHARFAPHEREALGSDGRQALESRNGTPQSDASAPVTRLGMSPKRMGCAKEHPIGYSVTSVLLRLETKYIRAQPRTSR